MCLRYINNHINKKKKNNALFLPSCYYELHDTDNKTYTSNHSETCTGSFMQVTLSGHRHGLQENCLHGSSVDSLGINRLHRLIPLRYI